MTKPSDIPSKWTLERAWRESAIAHCVAWTERGGSPILPFPADPVERVSDEKLEQFTTPVFNNTAMQLMALELIERRARDKEQKG